MCVCVCILQDVNDHNPVFETANYQASLLESVPVGTIVLSVSAVDDDSGVNSALQYGLLPLDDQSNATEYFWIDSYKGIVYTKLRLDFELMSVMTMVITAVDMGSPSRTGSSLLSIVVQDVNDKAPVFDNPSYEALLSGSLDAGQFVTKVTASDSDTVDRAQLRYAFVSGNEERLFIIDETIGLVSLSAVNKPQYFVDYILNISVTDGVFMAYCRLRVFAQPFNNHAPYFDSGLYEFMVSPTTDVIARLEAHDADLERYGLVSYDIVDGDGEDLFSLDSNTGKLCFHLSFAF